MFGHLDYLKGDFKLELKGLDNVNGESCYKVAVVDPNGQKTTEYYGAKSGHLLRTLVVSEVPGQDPVTVISDFTDYKEVEGFNQPGTITLTGAGPVPMAMKLATFKVNTEIDATLFDIPE